MRPSLTPEQLRKAIDLIRKGYAQVEVARRFGISSSTLSYLVKEATP